jgi:Glycosyl transferase family 2
MSRSRKLTSAVGDAFRKAGGVTSSQVQLIRTELRDEFRRELERLRDELRAPIGGLTEQVELLQARVDSLEHTRELQTTEVNMVKDLAGVEALSRWLRHATLKADDLVSVVLPSHGRPELLERAIASVRASSYENWELLVVEDGADEASKAVVQAAGDPRISWSQIPDGGVAAARNAALSRAKGTIIAYLDDDNLMDRDWLRAIVWAFEQRPEAEVLYGAFVIDDMLRVSGEDSGAMPWAFLNRWDRAALRQNNLADIGAIAHRAGLAEGHFDESLRTMADWDLLLRLTAQRDPLVLPAVACYYTTDAPDRLTKGPTHDADLARVLAKISDDAER